MNEAKRKGLGLIRVSTKRQAAEDRLSIPAQKFEIEKMVRANGFEIDEWIQYSDVSGSDVLDAPEIKYLLKRCESREIEAIFAFSFSRLMRVERGSEFGLLDLLADRKVDVYLPSQKLELASPMGKFVARMLASISGLEKEELKAKMRSNKEERRRAGLCPVGENCLPTGAGFDRRLNKWFYTKDSAKIREAAERVLAGESYGEVGKLVGLDRRSVRDLLANPIWIGERVYSKRKDPTEAGKVKGKDGRQGYRKAIGRAKDEILRVPINVDAPLFSSDEWERLQAILSARREHDVRERMNARTGEATLFPYHGFLNCTCGSPIYTGMTGGREGVYVCKCRRMRNRLPEGMVPCSTSYMMAEKLHVVLDSLLSKRLTDQGFIEEMIAEQNRRAKTSGSASTAKRLQGEIEKLVARRAKVLHQNELDCISDDEMKEKLQAIERERKTVDELLAREKPTLSSIPPERLEAILAENFAPFYEWKTLGTTSKRKLLHSILPSLKVADYKVHGFYALLPGLTDGGVAFNPAVSGPGLVARRGGKLTSNNGGRISTNPLIASPQTPVVIGSPLIYFPLVA